MFSLRIIDSDHQGNVYYLWTTAREFGKLTRLEHTHAGKEPKVILYSPDSLSENSIKLLKSHLGWGKYLIKNYKLSPQFSLLLLLLPLSGNVCGRTNLRRIPLFAQYFNKHSSLITANRAGQLLILLKSPLLIRHRTTADSLTRFSPLLVNDGGWWVVVQ